MKRKFRHSLIGGILFIFVDPSVTEMELQLHLRKVAKTANCLGHKVVVVRRKS